MSRNLDSNLLTAINQQSVDVIYLAAFDFTGGTLYVHSGYGNLSYGGHTYLGTGTFMGMTPVDETSDTSAKSISFSLSGVPDDLVELAVTDMRTSQGRFAKLYLGVFVDNGIIGSPITDFDGHPLVDFDGNPIYTFSGTVATRNLYVSQIYAGKMDTATITDDGKTSVINLTVENDLLRLLIPSQKLYVDSDQRALYPTDKFFEYVTGIQGADIEWGIA